jgi:hypothetical protein
VLEKWYDQCGQAWVQVTYNGVPCVVGDAVARQVSHPLLLQPLHVFPMQALEQVLQLVKLLPCCP